MLEQMIHDDNIVELRLARPPVNALVEELLIMLKDALESLPGEQVRAVFISGQAGVFSAGLDVPYLLTLDRDAMFDFWRSFFGLLKSIATSRVPVGMALTGHSPAGGAVLALFGDFRVAAEGEYKIGLNEVQVGLPMPDIVYAALRRLVGHRLAEQLAVSGRLISPVEAYRVGLVDELVPLVDVCGRTLERCRELVRLPQQAFAVTRDMARRELVGLFTGLDSHYFRQLNKTWFSEETQIAMRTMVASLAQRKDATAG